MTLEQFLEPLAGLGYSSLAALGITFVGGILASAVCPCTLPMGLGIAGIAGASEVKSRGGGLQISGAFFAGIVVSLTILGSLGGLATELFGRNWALAMAAVSLLAAVAAFSWPRVKALTAWRSPGVLGAFGYGLVFSLGTSVAPLLLLLAISAAQGPEQGIMRAFIFGLGRGVPFLLAGIVGSTVTGLTRLGLWSRTIQIISGVALLVVAAYYVEVYVDLL